MSHELIQSLIRGPFSEFVECRSLGFDWRPAARKEASFFVGNESNTYSVFDGTRFNGFSHQVLALYHLKQVPSELGMQDVSTATIKIVPTGLATLARLGVVPTAEFTSVTPIRCVRAYFDGARMLVVVYKAEPIPDALIDPHSPLHRYAEVVLFDLARPFRRSTPAANPTLLTDIRATILGYHRFPLNRPTGLYDEPFPSALRSTDNICFVGQFFDYPGQPHHNPTYTTCERGTYITSFNRMSMLFALNFRDGKIGVISYTEVCDGCQLIISPSGC